MALESWESLDLVKVEESSGDESGGKFSANLALGSMGSGAEDEMEDFNIPVKVDSCLLCAHTPAVTYDYDGNAIKRERTESDLELEYSYKQLFLNLCYLLGIRKKTRKLARNWNFLNEPFPFCEQCEQLLTSVTELYLKLEKLKEVAKQRIRKAEGIYLEEDLYGKHDRRYLEFRKLALGESIPRQVEKRKVVQHTTNQNNNGRSLRPRRQPQPVSRVTFVKSDLLLDDDVSDIILPEGKLKIPSLKKESRKKNTTGKKKLITRILKQSPKKLDKLDKLKKMKAKKTPSLKEKEGRKENLKSIDVPSEDHDSPSFLHENATGKNDNPPQEKSSKRNKRKKITRISTECSEDEREKRREQLLLKEKQAYDKKYSLLTKLETMSRSQMSHSELLVFTHSPIARDPYTGEVTLFAGFGNRFMNERSTLKFTKLESEGDDSSKIYLYKCQSCSEVISVKSMNSRVQLRIFRAHFRRSHMGIHKCKLCPSLPFFTTSPDLLAHLQSAHGLSTAEQMRNVFYQKAKSGTTRNQYYSCKTCLVCGMPFEKVNTIKFRLHLKTHMSEEERKSFITSGKAFYSEVYNYVAEQPIITQPHQVTNGSLCETCGSFVTGGSVGMAQHLQSHHNQPVVLVTKERHLCALCGESFSNSITLSNHTQLRHPNGNPDGPIICRYPTCNKRSFESEPSLEEHVSREHASSEANGKGLMCLKCGRVVTSSWAKKLHGNVHSGKKDFKCHRCPKSFPLKATLTNHLATVHREGEAVGVFECEVEGCGQVFPCQVYRGQHLRRDHGIYKRKQKKEDGKAS